MVKLRVKWEAKCLKHPAYNPAKAGAAGIKGNCDTCGELLSAWNLYIEFLRMLGEREAGIAPPNGHVSYGVPAHVLVQAARMAAASK